MSCVFRFLFHIGGCCQGSLQCGLGHTLFVVRWSTGCAAENTWQGGGFIVYLQVQRAVVLAADINILQQRPQAVQTTAASYCELSQ